MKNNNTLELIGHENRLQAMKINTCEGQNKNSEDAFFDIGMIENIPDDFLTEFEEEHNIYKDGYLRYDINDLAYYFVRICFYRALKKIRELQDMTQCLLSEKSSQEDHPNDYNPFDKDDHAEYFDDVHVLVIHDYPIIFAYKIGKTIEECKLIGRHDRICCLYAIIGNFLDSEKKEIHQ